jgi:rubredoxin
MGTHSSAHYHGADQFQIVVEGKGKLGHHELGTVSVHFARGYTPYGPLTPDKQEGWAFMTLRVRPNPVGTQRLPGAAEKLKAMPNRRPFQVSATVSFDREGVADVPAIRNEEGLFVSTIKLAPNGKALAPAPAGGDGQYIVVTRGSLVHAGREYKSLTVVYVSENESAYTAHAGAEGLEALVVNFPALTEAAQRPAPADAVMACTLCSFVYEQSQGLPGEGIRPGTPWEDIPEAWTCPDCGAGKKDFEKLDI